MRRPLVERILISCENLLAKAWDRYGQYLRRKRHMNPPIAEDYASVLEPEKSAVTVTRFEDGRRNDRN